MTIHLMTVQSYNREKVLYGPTLDLNSDAWQLLRFTANFSNQGLQPSQPVFVKKSFGKTKFS